MIVGDGVSPCNHQSNEFISTPTAPVISSRKAAEMRRRRMEGEEEVAGGSGKVEGSSLSQLSKSVDPVTAGPSISAAFLEDITGAVGVEINSLDW